ncbi:MAG TPA: cupredoxin family copper-binding protein [Terriglobales bacterium]
MAIGRSGTAHDRARCLAGDIGAPYRSLMQPSTEFPNTLKEIQMLCKAFCRVAINSTAAVMLFASVSISGLCAAKAQNTNTILIKGFDFSPMTLTVKVGTTVTWKNMDEVSHTVVSPDGTFRSEELDEGDTFTFKFVKPGTYKYACSIHPKMMASIVVR